MDSPQVVCSGCGHVLSQDAQNPCPECGGTARHYDVDLIATANSRSQVISHKPPSEEQTSNVVHKFATDGGHLSEKVVAHGTNLSGEMVRIVDSSGESVVADQMSDGSVQSSIEGRSRQGETGNLAICRILIERLNRDGGRWEEPTDTSGNSRTEEGVDCKVRDGKSVLNVQIVRAVIDQQFWSQLARDRQVAIPPATLEQAAESLCAPIRAKAKKITTSEQRREIVLALDATQTPTYGFRDVVDSFRQLHGQWANGLGFRGIWVVGPTPDLTARLDLG